MNGGVSLKDFSLFDIIGPSMIGPSSSHTAGATKLGKVAYRIASKEIKSVEFFLHGSFAKTYKGHGTDKALLGGILGFNPDDERIKYSFSLAKEKGIEYSFIESDLGEAHPNTVKIVVTKPNDEKVEILGSSIGGGNIVVSQINGLSLEFTGAYTTLIVSHRDKPGVVAKVTAILAEYSINIAFMRVYRYGRGENAFMVIETDDSIDKSIMSYIDKVDGISTAYLVTL